MEQPEKRTKKMKPKIILQIFEQIHFPLRYLYNTYTKQENTALKILQNLNFILYTFKF
ncbi:hypothetical protein CLV51_1011119 [Chitinophaga niastensis]|uniref:Uncharacterized protein n=1 Tax=Chitinophaga niastensis TaxID=536980 RepID=A0A2P8HU93_CHINA|nr:hypothetical protein CLV51_1011119 [Chitinophaga niastensis]